MTRPLRPLAALARRGAHLPPLNLVFEGDSTTRGFGATAGNDWPAVFAGMLRADGYTVTSHNQAVDGSAMATVDARAAADDALLDTTTPRVKNYIILLDGINDRMGGTTAADIVTAQASWKAARASAGWTPVGCTPYANLAPYGTTQADLAAGIRSNFADVIDFAAEPQIGTSANYPRYPNSLDGVHNPDYGYQVMAARAYADFRSNVLGLAARPVVTSVWEPIGLAGTAVDLYGVGLSGLSAVRFNGVAATTFAVVSASHATATVPATTTGPISVTGPAGSFTTPFVFTYADRSTWAPSITSLSPTHGMPLIGVDILGSRLIANTETVQGVTATGGYPIVLYGGGSGRTQVPNALSPGSAPFIHTNLYGSSAPFAFTCDAIPAPQITGGPTALANGGYGTYTGQGFSGAGVSCTFNGVAVAYYAPNSDVSVVIGLPGAPAGAHDLVITTPQGTSNAWAITIS